MIVDREILERVFARFTAFVSTKDNQPFTTFSNSFYIGQEESYKYLVCEKAKIYLGGKTSNYQWSISDVGTGRIQESINRAIKLPENNLVFRGSNRSYLSPLPNSDLENTLYDFYKNKITPQKAFIKMMENKIQYQLIAYLFFIKNKDQYLPISQERFDAIFSALGLSDFKTSRNASWENYSIFLSIIKNIQLFLKEKGTQPKLLDAHSFLWIFGNQMQEGKNIFALNLNSGRSENLISKERTTEGTKSEVNIVEEEDEMAFPEGRDVYRLHKTKERNIALIKVAKEKRLETDNGLHCEVCDFSFKNKYGELGDGFVEAHHLFPISELKVETATKMTDIALVCSNCHRMLHRRRPWVTAAILKSIVANQS